MIIRGGKLIYAVSLAEKTTEESLENTAYIYTQDGEVQFADGWMRRHEFDFQNESHQMAKEIFITELQADIKRRILELKQLQSVFAELNLSECFGTVLEDNTKLLIEVKKRGGGCHKGSGKCSHKRRCGIETVQIPDAPVALSKSGKKKKKELEKTKGGTENAAV